MMSADNVPFGGIPPELSALTDKILDKEPETALPDIHFSQQALYSKTFNLKNFLLPYKFSVFLAFMLVVIASTAQQAGPMLTAYAIDHGIRDADRHILLLCFLLYVVSIGVNVIASYYRIQFTGRLAQKLLYDLRIEVFAQLQRLSLNFFTGERTGRLVTRMTSDIEALSQLFTDGLVNLAVQGITLLLIIAALFYLNVELALVLLLLVVPIMLVLTLWFKSFSDKGYLIVRERIADVMADLQESLSAYKTIVTSNRRLAKAQAHAAIIQKHQQSNTTMSVAQHSYDGVTTFINIVGQVVILLYGFTLVQKNELSVGELIAFQLFLSNFFSPLQSLVQLYNGFQSANAAVIKLSDLFAEKIEVPEQKNPVHVDNLSGDIRFDKVSFYYQQNLPILKNINLEIKAGETIALVGPTGSGKSTLAKLITRFYDPQEGTIYLDGIDIKTLSFHSLRSHIAVVPQETFLFYDTVRANLAFSNPDISDQKIMQACKLMDIEHLVNKQRDGLNTMIGERGGSLSGGEKQLFALARAFISNPHILILDEATSNIDLSSEAKVEQALDVLLKDRTSIIIAHRLSTALRANRIVFVHEGQILESGTHEDLLKLKGAYAEFFKTWQKDEKN